MSKIRFLLLIVGLIPFLDLNSFAGPPVIFPSGDASWTVDVTPTGSSSGSAGAQIQKVEITQVNNVKRIILHWSDGKTTQKWTIPNLPVVFEEDPRDGTVTPFQDNSLMTKTGNLSLTYDSFAFTWLAPQYLQEKDPTSHQSKECFHYSLGNKEAWIDSATLLPVELDNGSSTSIFTFDPKPPTGPLVMPPKVQKAVHYFKVAMGYP